MIKELKNKINIIDILIFIIPLLSFTNSLTIAFLLAATSIIALLIKCNKEKKIIFPNGIAFKLLIAYLIFNSLVTFYAVDIGMNIFGCLKNLSLIFFIILLQQYQNEKDDFLRALPHSAIVSVFISILLIFINKEQFFYDDRLQGIFQYANSYGLFLLIGLLYSIKNQKGFKQLIFVLIMLVGILLTNSRAIIILTVVSICYELISNKHIKNRKYLIILIVSLLTIFVILAMHSVIENRINLDMFTSGGMVLRSFYYNDALNMIKENPFGYGYLGWYYKQAEIKTANYDTLYIHNSLLQLIVDYGIISALLILTFLYKGLTNKKQTAFNRVTILLILFHSLIDIDMEFIIFPMIIFSAMQYEHREIKLKKKSNIILCIFLCIYAVFASSTILYDLNLYENAYGVIPFYTEALQAKLYSTDKEDEQISLAKRCIELNKCISGAYEALTIEAINNSKYDEACEYAYNRIKLNKYNVESYDDYADVLVGALNYYIEKQDNEKIKKYAQQIVDIENIIADVETKSDKRQNVKIEISDYLAETIADSKTALSLIK